MAKFSENYEVENDGGNSMNDEDAPADKAIWYIKFVSGELKDCTAEVNDEIF